MISRDLVLQIYKFSIVGLISFIIDFGVYTLLCNHYKVPYLIAGFFAFAISVIVNYCLSMRYVFVRNNELSTKREFITFVVLSAVGLGLNEIILYVCLDLVYNHWSYIQTVISQEMANIAAKIIATGIVMIYNFVSRKLLFEKKGS